jgi:hypothetical protein
MELDRMKDIIVTAYKGQAQMQDAIDLVSEFMIDTRGSIHQPLMDFMLQHSNPISMQMLQRAFEISMQYFENTKVVITKLYSKDLVLLNVY